MLTGLSQCGAEVVPGFDVSRIQFDGLTEALHRCLMLVQPGEHIAKVEADLCVATEVAEPAAVSFGCLIETSCVLKLDGLLEQSFGRGGRFQGHNILVGSSVIRWREIEPPL